MGGGVAAHGVGDGFQELLETTGGLYGGGVELQPHLLCHLGGLARRLDKGGEDGPQLGGHFCGVAAHARQGGEGGHQLIDAHAEGGGVGRDRRECGHLYLVLNGRGLAPFKAVVLYDGRGDVDHRTELGDAAHAGLGRRLEVTNPVVLWHAVGDDLVQASCKGVACNGDGGGKVGDLLLHRGEASGVLTGHRVGLAHGGVEVLALPGDVADGSLQVADGSLHGLYADGGGLPLAEHAAERAGLVLRHAEGVGELLGACLRVDDVLLAVNG